jgi:hypothetical protein
MSPPDSDYMLVPAFDQSRLKRGEHDGFRSVETRNRLEDRSHHARVASAGENVGSLDGKCQHRARQEEDSRK